MLVVVQKPFKGNGIDFIRDQLIDANQFRNKDILLGQRFFRPATEDEINSAYLSDDVEHRPVHASSGVSMRLRRRRRR